MAIETFVETYRKLTKIAPESIYSLFFKQYTDLHGEIEGNEIAREIEKSNEVNQYLNFLSINRSKPTTEDLQALLNAIPYFFSAKPETLCLGGLNVLYRWQIQNMPGVEGLGQTKNSPISAEFIFVCSDIMVHQNVFRKFFHEVEKYEPIQFDW